jgi:hypothetical protein
VLFTRSRPRPKPQLGFQVNYRCLGPRCADNLSFVVPYLLRDDRFRFHSVGDLEEFLFLL